MELVISHFEGCSGNFIGHLYANKEFDLLNKFRVDLYRDPYVLAINGRDSWSAELKNCKEHKILVSHQFNKELIHQTFPNAQKIAIWPYTKQMNVLWNICYKKIPVSRGHNIDYYYINLKDWHIKLQEHTPRYQCFDYGQLTNSSYVESMLKITLDSRQQKFFNDYWKNQLQHNLTWPIEAMPISDIILWYGLANDITDWNIALVLYTFETINNLQESQRKWSIDNVNNTSWAEIIELQHKYYNF